MSTGTTSKPQSAIDALRQVAAEYAAAHVQDGMVVGLGSGGTARMAVRALGDRVRSGLRVTGIPTSEKTADLARRIGIPLATLAEYPAIDVTIDGADEVETGTLNLIKGGGGNQLREKIVACSSARLVIVVDEEKLVTRLGERARLPVEVARFGWQATAASLRALGGEPSLRPDEGDQHFVTDGGNYILDCKFGPIADAAGLQRKLDGIVGLVEHGLFIGMAAEVVIGTPAGVRLLTRG